MAQQEMDTERFVDLASSLGFDRQDPHLDELYPWVLAVLEAIAPLDKLDLTGVPLGLGIASDREA